MDDAQSRPGVASIWSCMNLRHTRWVRLAAFAVLLMTLAIVAAPVSHAQSASTFYKRGQEAEARGDYDAAFAGYSKAYQKSPSDIRYQESYERTRSAAAAFHVHKGEQLRDAGNDAASLTEYLRALEIDPSYEVAQQDIHATQLRMSAPTPGQETPVTVGSADAMSEVAAPVELKPVSNEPLTMHMVEDSKVVYQTIGKAAGINVLFDPDYTSKRIQVDLSNVSLMDALRIVGTVSDTFWRPITSNTIFVAQNSRAKRQELDEQAVQTFYLSNSSQPTDLNDIQTALRNVLANAKLYGVPSQDAIVMRATPDELLLAQKLINDLDKARPEVVIDIAVLEVSRDKMRQIGIQLPQTASVAFQASPTATSTTSTTDTTTTSGLTLNSLAHLNANNFAVTVGQATANLLLSDSDTRVLQNPRIRASDNQKASLKIGSRIPEATGSFSSGLTTSATLGVQTQFQYIDVGVNIDVTPTVHYDRDVTLKLKIEVSSESGQTTISGVQEPIISQRTIEDTIRLKEGEANILGGILQRNDSVATGGTPGLSEIPLLKYLFGSRSTDHSTDEIVFLLIPHVVRATELSPMNLQQIDTGAGTTIELRRMPAAEVPAALKNIAAPVATGVPGVSAPVTVGPGSGLNKGALPIQPTPGSPTGQALTAPGGTSPITAAAAADAAVAQMKAAPATATAAAAAAPPIQLQLTPAESALGVGNDVQLTINLAGGVDVFSVPMQVQYDASKLTLINVDAGGFLGSDGQAVALVHRDDGSGGVAISASRPPGASGMNGSGQVCILTFQGKAAGDAVVSVTRPGARNSAQQALNVQGSQAIVHVH
jgi:general secretion pathway protein D